MNRMSRPLLVLLALLVSLGTPFDSALAQDTGTITGAVRDAASQRPLQDAQVSVPGTGRGTLTNSQGRFLLTNVPTGSVTVRVELIGYGTLERQVTVQAGQPASLDFDLSQDAIALQELVVTGVGQQTERRQLATSVSTLSADEISQAPVTSVDQLLQGRVAGATVNAQSAQAGTSALINFRGVSSVVGAQTPVIYVDGVRVDNSIATAAGTGGEQSSALADLLTADIERIEVTRGGAASTLFGSDAATGVIQIFTKKGRPGDARITWRSDFGSDVPQLKYMFDTPLTFPDLVEAGETSPTFMQDNFWKNSFYLSQYLSASGGSDALTYNVSGRLQNDDGVQPNNESTIYSVRGGLQAQVNDDFTLNFSGNYTRSNFERLFNGTAIADPLTTFEVGDALFFSGAQNLDEALDIFLSPDIDETVNRFIFSGGFNWSIGESLFARFTTGIDYRGNSQRILQPIGFTPGEPTGELTRYDRTFTSFSLDAAISHSWTSQDGRFGNSFTVGAQGFRNDESIVSSTGTTFGLPGAPDFDQAADITSFEINEQLFQGGIYFDETFDLWQKLTLNAGLRIDGSTAFGDEVTSELYPKAGVSYLISEEAFWPDVISQFKLRGAYGETGKPPSPFDKDRSFSSIPFRGESAPRFDNPGNQDLAPERTSTIELGFDASFLTDRIGLEVTWYDAKTQDALFFVPEQPTTGQGTQLRNLGEIQNTGWEVAWNAQVINASNFAWSLGGTLQWVDNEVTDMGGAADFFVEPQKRVAEGRPVGAWYVTTPVDTNGDGLADDSELMFTGGQPIPESSGSVNTNFRIGTAISVSAMGDWAMGHQVMDFGSVWSTFNGIYRRETVRCGDEPSPDCGFVFPVRYDLEGNEIGRYSQSAARSAFIYDGDWFKLREVTVRYSLPDRIANTLFANRGSVYASGRNLWIWSKNQLIDPELNGLSGDGLALGSESSITASPPLQFRFGFELMF